MRSLSGEELAELAGADIVRRGGAEGPARATIDSRQIREEDLFVGIPGERHDGGEFAGEALRSGAWGVIISRDRAAALDEANGWVLAAEDPLRALQRLAREWRRRLDFPVIGITGSTGKTSVKDICRVLLGESVHASPENYNTEIGLPLALLAAPPDAEVAVLEMAMRGSGQIRELRDIAEPDVVVVTNVGPVHVELLGTLEAIAAAKAEAVENLGEGAAVVPADAGPLEPHLVPGGASPSVDQATRIIRFGEGGDVLVRKSKREGAEIEAQVAADDESHAFHLPFTEAYNVDNALAAIAAGRALGLSLAEMADRAPGIGFSRLRGELVELGGGAILINDCYNANPVSMRAALDHLASLPVEGRRLAVLGEMKELGPQAESYHREIGAHARQAGADFIIGVGELAAAYAPDEMAPDAATAAEILRRALRPGDAVLVKGSRAVALEEVAERLR